MELKLKDMYSFLLSHTFPGLFFGIELLLSMKWFANLDSFSVLQELLSKPDNTGVILAVILICYAFATLLGFIIDGIHHFFYEDFLRGNKIGYHSVDDSDIFCAVNNLEKMSIYQHFIDDDYWYPYETYANISIAMIPGIFLLPYKLYSSQVAVWFTFTLCILYALVLFIMIYEAIYTLRICSEKERQLIEVLKTAHNSDKSNYANI
jgi:hypothetical protein